MIIVAVIVVAVMVVAAIVVAAIVVAASFEALNNLALNVVALIVCCIECHALNNVALTAVVYFTLYRASCIDCSFFGSYGCCFGHHCFWVSFGPHSTIHELKQLTFEGELVLHSTIFKFNQVQTS